MYETVASFILFAVCRNININAINCTQLEHYSVFELIYTKRFPSLLLRAADARERTIRLD